jgi:hypothetical protein
MNTEDRDQEAVAAVLKSLPAQEVSPGFVARVNARIDETAGWLGLADFRKWTLGLVPAAAALVLAAILWPAAPSAPSSSASSSNSSSPSSSPFMPSSYEDWQRDVTANALLETALSAKAPSDVR